MTHIIHEPNIPVTDFDDNSKTTNYSITVTLQCQFVPNNIDIVVRELYATTNHGKYFPTSGIHKLNVERVRLHRNVAAKQMY